MSIQPIGSEWMTVREFCKYFYISRSTFYQLLRQGNIKKQMDATDRKKTINKYKLAHAQQLRHFRSNSGKSLCGSSCGTTCATPERVNCCECLRLMNQLETAEVQR